MKIRRRYCVVWKSGRKVKWARFSHHGGFHLLDFFEPACLLDEDQVDGFLRRPGIDPRYCKAIVTMDAEIVQKRGAKR